LLCVWIRDDDAVLDPEELEDSAEIDKKEVLIYAAGIQGDDVSIRMKAQPGIDRGGLLLNQTIKIEFQICFLLLQIEA
jgi:hypothetical protein